LKNLPPAIASFNKGASEELGMCMVTAIVGPNPEEGGKIDIWWYVPLYILALSEKLTYTRNTNGENGMGLRWDEFDPPTRALMENSLIKFGRSTYSAYLCTILHSCFDIRECPNR
jgi:hypothetical protein